VKESPLRLLVRFPFFTLFSFAVVLIVQPFSKPDARGQQEQTIGGFPGTAPSSTQIDRLIRQLGSDRFLERKVADDALGSIGRPALAALRRASSQSKDPEVRKRARRLVECIENRLDCLLDDYRSYGLPLPPAGAKLIRFNSSENCTCNGMPLYHYALGFLLPAVDDPKDRVVLYETSARILGSDTRIIRVPPEQAKDLSLADLRGFSFNSESTLLTAVQCEALGWHTLAQLLLEHSSVLNRENDAPRMALARLAWEDWSRKLPLGDTDWKKASDSMRILLAEPILNTSEHRHLLRSLDMALVPSKAKPGSIEAMIDDLIESPDILEFLKREPDSKYVRIYRQGMAAVPTLLEHLDDDRLTRRQSQRPNKWQFHHDRVRDIVSDLLRDLADGELGRKSWRSDIKPEALEKGTARAWWNEARHLGEEPYLLAHALPTEAGNRWPNQAILRALAEKYPRQLLKVYRTLLDERPEIHSWPLVELVAESSLPEKEKLGMLRYAEKHADSEHRLAAQLGIEKLTQKPHAPTQ
jgi:hypothetical protein